MSESATLARPYAEAVFKTAKESNLSAKWSDMLAFLSAVVKDSNMSAIINNPRVGSERLVQLLLDICQGQLNQEGANFLKLLVENNRLLLLPAITKLYEEYKAEDEGYVDVEVLTAYPLTKEEQKQFASSLEKKLNKRVHMKIDVDKSLIGGIRVRAGDKVIDGSIRGRLQQLAKRLY